MLAFFFITLLSVAVVEIFNQFGLKGRVKRFTAILNKSLHVVLSDKISDNWKEKVLPLYSLNLLTSSISIMFICFVPLASFLLLCQIDNNLMGYALSIPGAIHTICIVFFYQLIRVRLGY